MVVLKSDFNEICDCQDCVETEYLCHMDCQQDLMCWGCQQYSEELKDREFDEMVALGYI